MLSYVHVVALDGRGIFLCLNISTFVDIHLYKMYVCVIFIKMVILNAVYKKCNSTDLRLMGTIAEMLAFTAFSHESTFSLHDRAKIHQEELHSP